MKLTKRVLAGALAACMLTGLTACGSSSASSSTAEAASEETAEVVGMANPMTEYSSLEEVNAAVGCSLIGPGAMGVQDEVYAVIDCGGYIIGHYKFAIGAGEYTFRAAETQEDISGVYVGDGTMSDLLDEKAGANTEGVLWQDGEGFARWYVGTMQYSLYGTGDGLDEETFTGAAEELKDLSEMSEGGSVSIDGLNPIKYNVFAYDGTVENGEWCAVFDGSTLQGDAANGWTVQADIYTVEQYDADAAEALAVGDSISNDGNVIYIESIDFSDEYISINGGDPSEENGLTLRKTEDGVYVAMGFDDMATFAYEGTAELTLLPDFEFSDYMEKISSCDVLTGADAAAVIGDTEEFWGASSTLVDVEDGAVIAVVRYYVP